MSDGLKLGLAGVGTVGSGLLRLLAARKAELAARAGRPIEVVAVSAKNRRKNRDVLNAEIAAIMKTRKSAEWIEILNRAGVPCGPIFSIDQMFGDPQVAHLGIAQPVKKNGKTMQLVGQPMSLSRTPSKLTVWPPEIGEHTDEVLAEFGFNTDEIAALRKANAI